MYMYNVVRVSISHESREAIMKEGISHKVGREMQFENEMGLQKNLVEGIILKERAMVKDGQKIYVGKFY